MNEIWMRSSMHHSSRVRMVYNLQQHLLRLPALFTRQQTAAAIIFTPVTSNRSLVQIHSIRVFTSCKDSQVSNHGRCKIFSCDTEWSIGPFPCGDVKYIKNTGIIIRWGIWVSAVKWFLLWPPANNAMLPTDVATGSCYKPMTMSVLSSRRNPQLRTLHQENLQQHEWSCVKSQWTTPSPLSIGRVSICIHPHVPIDSFHLFERLGAKSWCWSDTAAAVHWEMRTTYI